ncbi:hypothetical protein SAMN05444365_10480 [Micromonospora pattaloongensis]|uniref:Uncharacterized protein n=1 Tax=Micromonospora pattaloongensis TaxID=405436 RepID=A0A1H3NP62_9ACTN|nr:hypothetical protein [Micromonospora pattaloongensis]SDY90460.1 hypothetical protein SAMN05444365_10480 [Micromonospora pattaloongensis]
MTHPYPPPHHAPAQPRRSRAWLWTVIAVGAVTVAGAGVLLASGTDSTPPDAADGEPRATVGAPTPPADVNDAAGLDACERLRGFGATTFDPGANRELGELAGRSVHSEIVTAGRNLIAAVEKAAGQDPIDANLALSRAQLALGDACTRTFGAAAR